MDEPLKFLSLSGVGCYVGNKYCGSVGYADDAILLAPTLCSMKKLLLICETFSKEYDVIFNSQKSKLLVYRCNSNSHINEHLHIDGQIDQSLNEKHLGNILGSKCNSNMITQTVNDFYVKVNIVLSHFMHAHSHIRYTLFKSYCMSLYGSQLWDFQSKTMETFYVAWRKSVRRILGVPPTTHCKYLHYIADDRDIKTQLYIRFTKFIQSAYQSSNLISNLCVKMALLGSRSNISNNISIVCKMFGMTRNNICICKPAYRNINNMMVDGDTQIITNVIKELLYLKHCLRVSIHPFVLNVSEIDHIITQLCTD